MRFVRQAVQLALEEGGFVIRADKFIVRWVIWEKRSRVWNRRELVITLCAAGSRSVSRLDSASGSEGICSPRVVILTA
jgi:hypothetical protein